jgi:hypothetical protein
LSEAVTNAPASPKASRLALPRWLDPKLLLGLLLVIVAMLLGARVFASADDTVAVYQVKAAMFTGDALTTDSVAVTRVHFSQGSVAANYVSATRPLPTGQVVNHDLRAGEMLTQGSVSPKAKSPTVELSVPISTGDTALVTKNSRVDVVVVPNSTTGAATKAAPTKVLSNVLVTSVPGGSGGAFSSGSTGGSSITVRVNPASQTAFDSVKLAASLHDSTVYIIKLDDQSP